MQLAGEHVLVTGGAGFIGSHLVDTLVDCEVRVLDDFSTGRRENLSLFSGGRNVEILEGDIRQRSEARRALQGVTVVFHLACRGVRHSIGKPMENHEVNATGTLVLLEESKRAGVRRFVHISSSEAYGTARYVPMDENHPTFPETVYGSSKLAGECYARAYHQTYGFPTVVVRPFNNFGPRSHFEGDSGEVIPRFIIWALNGKPHVIFGDGSQTRDFIYVEDTAHWLRRIAECDELLGKTLNLGSGVETSVRELASLVCEQVGCTDTTPDYRDPRPGDVLRHCADTTLAKREIDFRVRTSVPEGVQKTLEYFKQQGDPATLLQQIDQANWTLTEVGAGTVSRSS